MEERNPWLLSDSLLSNRENCPRHGMPEYGTRIDASMRRPPASLKVICMCRSYRTLGSYVKTSPDVMMRLLAVNHLRDKASRQEAEEKEPEDVVLLTCCMFSFLRLLLGRRRRHGESVCPATIAKPPFPGRSLAPWQSRTDSREEKKKVAPLCR